MTNRPRSAADPRPDGQPYYITSTCPDCGTALELHDELAGTDGDVWHDEWTCPECDNGIYLDTPTSAGYYATATTGDEQET
jgi:hypothetical protein